MCLQVGVHLKFRRFILLPGGGGVGSEHFVMPGLAPATMWWSAVGTARFVATDFNPAEEKTVNEKESHRLGPFASNENKHLKCSLQRMFYYHSIFAWAYFVLKAR
jgi:hypothetical protein